MARVVADGNAPRLFGILCGSDFDSSCLSADIIRERVVWKIHGCTHNFAFNCSSKNTLLNTYRVVTDEPCSWFASRPDARDDPGVSIVVYHRCPTSTPCDACETKKTDFDIPLQRLHVSVTSMEATQRVSHSLIPIHGKWSDPIPADDVEDEASFRTIVWNDPFVFRVGVRVNARCFGIVRWEVGIWCPWSVINAHRISVLGEPFVGIRGRQQEEVEEESEDDGADRSVDTCSVQ